MRPAGSEAGVPKYTPEEMAAAWSANGKSIAATARKLCTSRNVVKKYLARAAERGLLDMAQKVAAHSHRVEQPAEKPRVRVRSGRMKVMVIGDAHDSPGIAKDRFAWMGKFAADERPTHIVQIGDLLTLDSLNGHIGNSTFSGRLKGTFLDDMASGNEALALFNEQLPGGYTPHKHVALGNHERRLYLFEENAPETAGMMQCELESLLSRHGWAWSPFGQFHYLGGVGFVHCVLNRMGRPYGGKNAETTLCNEAMHDLVIGHSHTGRVWKAPKIGPSQHVTVVNAGCALPDGHIEEYARHSLTGWTWGVTVLEIEGGHIVGHQFVSMATLEDRYS